MWNYRLGVNAGQNSRNPPKCSLMKTPSEHNNYKTEIGPLHYWMSESERLSASDRVMTL